jgi:hypothetical protein
MHKRLIVAASVLVLAAATTAPAWAGWGCGAQGFAGQGRTWRNTTRAQAAAGALRLCRQAGGRHCRLVSCSPNVDTEGQADAMWPPVAPDNVRCKGALC